MGGDRSFRHIGFIVDDVQAYARALSTVLPELGPWRFVTFNIDSDVVTVGGALTLSVATASDGALAYELIQVIDQSEAHPFWATRGLHHVSYEQKGDLESELDRLVANGYEIRFAANLRDGESLCFLESPIAKGFAIELNTFVDGYPVPEEHIS